MFQRVVAAKKKPAGRDPAGFSMATRKVVAIS
jgi:hypothetical protein